MLLASFVLVPWMGVAGFLWIWLLTESFQMVSIVRLNAALFAHIERLKFTYLRRLIGVCVPALLLSLLLLHRTSVLSMPVQSAIAVGACVLVAGIDWQLFRVREVLHKIVGQFTSRFAEPA
jgi:hypothetical protein